VERHLEILHTVAETVSRSLDVEEVLRTALDALTHVTGHEISSLHLFSEDGRTLHLRGDRGLSDENGIDEYGADKCPQQVQQPPGRVGVGKRAQGSPGDNRINVLKLARHGRQHAVRQAAKQGRFENPERRIDDFANRLGPRGGIQNE